MWPNRYWPTSYWSAHYWPKEGASVVIPDLCEPLTVVTPRLEYSVTTLNPVRTVETECPTSLVATLNPLFAVETGCR